MLAVLIYGTLWQGFRWLPDTVLFSAPEEIAAVGLGGATGVPDAPTRYDVTVRTDHPRNYKVLPDTSFTADNCNQLPTSAMSRSASVQVRLCLVSI